jgi:hypothetical protein
MPLRLSLCLLFLGFTSLAQALPGSRIKSEDILALLKQQPGLYAFVTDTLELKPEGSATRVLSNKNPALWSGVSGPYSIEARPRSSSARWTFLLTVETEVTFRNEAGREVPLDFGTSIHEKVIGIRLLAIESK